MLHKSSSSSRPKLCIYGNFFYKFRTISYTFSEEGVILETKKPFGSLIMVSKSNGTKRTAAEAKKNGVKKPKLQKKVTEEVSESEEQESEVDASSAEEDALDEISSSDDELDNLSEGEEEEGDDLDGGEDDAGSDEGSSEDKTTSKERHAEQRKLLAERKMHRKAGAEIQKIKHIWEKLRVKKPGLHKEKREQLSNEMWELSKDIILDLVMKHDASRIVQTLVKYSSKERRKHIAEALKGSFYQLATSSYGKYLLVKLLHYGSKDVREMIVNELHGKIRKLMRHKEGAYVVEDLYVLYSNSEQRKQIIREFWGSEYAVFKDSGKNKTVLDVINESSEKRQLIMQNLSGTITASVNKGSTGFQILHAAMRDYVSILEQDSEKNDKEIREFVDLLAEQFAELVHTEEGCEVACSLVAMANAKERKVIVRSLKKHEVDLVKNEFGNVVMICIYMTIDDTVLVHKALNVDLLTNELLPELVQHKYARRPLLYLLKALDPKYFSGLIRKDLEKYEKLAYAKTSKKPQTQRREELLEKCLPLIYRGILGTVTNSADIATFSSLLSNNLAAQFITELTLTPTDNEEVNNELRPQLVDAFFNVAIKGDILEDYHLLNKVPFISRAIKAAIWGNEFKWDGAEKKLVKVSDAKKIPSLGLDFATRVLNEILNEDKISDWFVGQGAFILTALYEVFNLSEDKKSFKKLKSKLEKNKSALKENEDNKGVQILLKYLS
ncbi:Piso0_004524 [Millerozyma farinosa CBS 7064]|uniref:Piso0_004524 protein n=1 Tax=Pichia sorbitophila (strain ATCC MYA-4447 / BCRC 22081 / CBS 7064 / NBRC 10061 / NRRL Y-12695) TaxID=559304 RepID=G8Y5P7_PICSO|nr:Piso0_004524 [Millerozyma farinosa CBS 7064]CCE84958.1 Piso0_004524 [Millerozyma farinosa CBS 7064]